MRRAGGRGLLRLGITLLLVATALAFSEKVGEWPARELGGTTESSQAPDAPTLQDPSPVVVDAAPVAPAPVVAAGPARDTVGLFDPRLGRWYLRDPAGTTTSFSFGAPAGHPLVGDWDCDGIDTPGVYQSSGGYIYLRNSNSSGASDFRLFLG
ncbi:MAG: hypothetical protein ACE5KX_07665, partial [Acidimicrobiia bacterium]